MLYLNHRHNFEYLRNVPDENKRELLQMGMFNKQTSSFCICRRGSGLVSLKRNNNLTLLDVRST